MSNRTSLILEAARGERSQAECALAAGVSKQRWSQWEAGARIPPERVAVVARVLGLGAEDHRRLMAEALGVTVADLPATVGMTPDANGDEPEGVA